MIFVMMGVNKYDTYNVAANKDIRVDEKPINLCDINMFIKN